MMGWTVFERRGSVMDKTLAGLIGAVGALAAVAPAQAAPALDDVMRAESYADLLRPIPNAAVLLQASDAMAEARPEVLEVQYYRHHHHHHHHHGYYRPRYYGPAYAPPGYYRRGYHHHHHHHHHHGFGIIIR